LWGVAGGIAGPDIAASFCIYVEAENSKELSEKLCGRAQG